jgi:hypothetical protein
LRKTANATPLGGNVADRFFVIGFERDFGPH